MGCCWSDPRFEDNKPLIVDLSEILSDSAWRNFRVSLGQCQKRSLKRKDFVIEVPENYFDFKDIRQANKFAVPAPAGQQSSKGQAKNQETNLSRLLQTSAGRGLSNPETVTLKTEFSNETAEKQTYKFRFEKTRRTELEVTFQKGFTMGGKANFSINIPFVDAGVEAEMQYQVTKSQGQKFEESMVMEATSDIVVAPNSHYTANVQLEEKALHASFKVVTQMSMPQGRAPIYIKRKADDEKVFVYYVNNLIDIFNDAVPCAEIVKEDGEVIHTKINFVTEGVVKGSLACNHKIVLTSIEPDSVKNDAKTNYIRSITG